MRLATHYVISIYYSHESSVNIFVVIYFIKLRGIISFLIFPNIPVIQLIGLLKEVFSVRF